MNTHNKKQKEEMKNLHQECSEFLNETFAFEGNDNLNEDEDPDDENPDDEDWVNRLFNETFMFEGEDEDDDEFVNECPLFEGMYTTFIIRDRYENPVNLFYDDPADHPKDYIPRIKFQLDYEYLPNLENTGEMNLVDKPEIMCGDTSNLKKEDIAKLKRWVKKYRKTIFKWEGGKDVCPLSECLDLIKNTEIKPENEDSLYDIGWAMTRIPSKYDLPTTVHFDDSEEYDFRKKNNQSYIPRIKFVGNPKEPNCLFRVYVPMSIEDEPRLLMPEMKHTLSENEIEILKDWVKKHKKQLLKVTHYSTSRYSNIDFLEYLKNYGKTSIKKSLRHPLSE